MLPSCTSPSAACYCAQYCSEMVMLAHAAPTRAAAAERFHARMYHNLKAIFLLMGISVVSNCLLLHTEI